MKSMKAIYGLAAAALLAFPAGAQAGNTAVIKQEGGGTAHISQSGKGNTATIVQGGAKKELPETKEAGHSTNTKLKNVAVIEQTGDENTARQEQKGEDNVALVGQKGDGNTAVQTQDGEHNMAGALQKGKRNTVTHSQTGEGHKSMVFETGDGVTVTVSESGTRR